MADLFSALAHADNAAAGWSDRAYSFLKTFARGRSASGLTFKAEDVRGAWVERGEPDPVANAWGGLFRRAVRDRVVVMVGAEAGSTEKSRGSLRRIYRAGPSA